MLSLLAVEIMTDKYKQESSILLRLRASQGFIKKFSQSFQGVSTGLFVCLYLSVMMSPANKDSTQ